MAGKKPRRKSRTTHYEQSRPDDYEPRSADCERARQMVDAAVARHAKAWAVKIGLTLANPLISQFREDVTWALDECMRLHILGNQYRPTEFRRDLLALCRAYIAVAEKLREAKAIRDHCLPLPLLNEYKLGPLPTEHQLMARAEAVRLVAEEWKQRHAPLKPAFSALAEGLVLAYRRATGDTGVGYGAREGKLLALVKRVLRDARRITKAVTGKPLETPATPNALGEYLHNVASAKD